MSGARRLRRWLFALAAAVLALAGYRPLAAPAAAAPTSEEILRRAAEVLEHPSYQTELPGREADPEGNLERSEEPTWSDAISRLRSLPAALAGGRLVRTLLWILVALALAAAAVWLLRAAARDRLRRARLGAPADRPPPGGETRPAAPPPGLDEIEALARRGAYGEAVHLLLRRAIALLARRRPLSPALTSREVPRAAGLVPPVRGAFEELAGSAERFRFGGARLRREDYERSAAAYRTVAGGAEGER